MTMAAFISHSRVAAATVAFSSYASSHGPFLRVPPLTLVSTVLSASPRSSPIIPVFPENLPTSLGLPPAPGTSFTPPWPARGAAAVASQRALELIPPRWAQHRQ